MRLPCASGKVSTRELLWHPWPLVSHAYLKILKFVPSKIKILDLLAQVAQDKFTKNITATQLNWKWHKRRLQLLYGEGVWHRNARNKNAKIWLTPKTTNLIRKQNFSCSLCCDTNHPTSLRTSILKFSPWILAMPRWVNFSLHILNRSVHFYNAFSSSDFWMARVLELQWFLVTGLLRKSSKLRKKLHSNFDVEYSRNMLGR